MNGKNVSLPKTLTFSLQALLNTSAFTSTPPIHHTPTHPDASPQKQSKSLTRTQATHSSI
jgi:hypothetical protein